MNTQLRILKNQACLNNFNISSPRPGYTCFERDGLQFIFKDTLEGLISHSKFYVFTNGVYFGEDYIEHRRYYLFVREFNRKWRKWRKLWILKEN